MDRWTTQAHVVCAPSSAQQLFVGIKRRMKDLDRDGLVLDFFYRACSLQLSSSRSFVTTREGDGEIKKRKVKRKHHLSFRPSQFTNDVNLTPPFLHPPIVPVPQSPSMSTVITNTKRHPKSTLVCLPTFVLLPSSSIPPSMDAVFQAIIAAATSFFFVAFIFGLIYVCCLPRPKTHCHHHPRSAGPNHYSSSAPYRQPRIPYPDESASFDPNLHISMSVLREACGNFSPNLVIGDGSFGLVYKAQLPNGGPVVAVKKLSPDAFHGFREFAAEMETLAKILHPNLARILGYCISGQDRILVYEFLEKGSLDQWLHESSEDRIPLNWSTRLRIVRGVAAGLAFLHNECQPCIIHRDIKSSNVLLDDNFEAHIADFGLARTMDSSRSHVSTQVAGTMGYMPPEYRDGQIKATAKADVYSFGVLMLEVATGRRPNLPVWVAEKGRVVGFVMWVRWMTEEERWSEILDLLMGEEGIAEAMKEMEVVKGYLKLALWCAGEASKERPSMVEAVNLLGQL